MRVNPLHRINVVYCIESRVGNEYLQNDHHYYHRSVGFDDMQF